MQTPRYRSTALAILIVGVVLGLIGAVPDPRTNGMPDFPHPLIWAGIVALFALTPYAAVWMLSSPTQSAARHQAARGIAAGTAAAAIVALGLSLLVALYVGVFGSSTLLTLQIASCVLLISMNVRMGWLAIRKGAPLDGVFVAGAVAPYILAGLATRSLQRIDTRAADRMMAPQRNAYAVQARASNALRQLAVCASTYRMSHGGVLPADLPTLVSVAGCDQGLGSPSGVPQYTLSLAIDPADTVSPDATMGCKFTATFAGKLQTEPRSELDGRSFSSTCAGRVYERGYGEPETARTRSSELPWQFNIIFRGVVLTARASGGRYPTTLTELLASPHLKDREYTYDAFLLNRMPRADLDSNVFRIGYYVARYIPDTNDFRIEVRCEPYGPMCMRGYMIDHSGVVRATGEPRPARATDPLAERCEITDVSCDGQPGSLAMPKAATPAKQPSAESTG